MAVLSVRLNDEEEEMVSFLTDYYNAERSLLIKHALNELYEDVVNNRVIENFEKVEKKRGVNFMTAAEIMSSV